MNKKTIEQLEKKINHNLFINDLDWRERAIDNIEYAKQIRQIISRGILDNTIKNRKYQVELLDFLDYHNL
ncbi:MAG: hypothetical protein GWO87_03375 [Xanthomonadaceae bacterium]|nr:hypothetical protein [Rhodospirillaceae bacterium]NIA18202.1 hypothetical protein [Xanthomonadaceae bacterium]